jgi:hypothetical protein
MHPPARQQVEQERACAGLLQRACDRLIAGTVPAAPAPIREEHNAHRPGHTPLALERHILKCKAHIARPQNLVGFRPFVFLCSFRVSWFAPLHQKRFAL